MGDDPGLERRPRARPVADAPVAALLAQADDLAKRWAIELILARPLASLAEVPLEDLAREAPELCAQLVRALASDAELELLVVDETASGRGDSPPAHRLAAFARARDARSCVEQAEALRGVLWIAAMGELRDPSVRLVADLSDRLAYVCMTALASALELSPAVTANVHEPQRVPQPPPGRAQVLYSSQQPLGGRGGAVLVDERDPEPPRPARVAARREGVNERSTPGPERTGASRDSAREPAAAEPLHETPRGGRPLPWDTPLRAERDERRPSPPPRVEDTPDARSDGAPVGEDPVMRITRRSVSPIDERQ
jgi:hypothetical protein